jgi:hypothetical protein
MRDRSGAVAAIVLAAAACQTPAIGEPGPSGRQENDKIILNGLRVETFEAALPALVEEGGGPLTGERLTATADGRELLGYVARCALDVDQAVVGAGGPYWGELGLARDWLERAPTAAEGRWVSACLIASINADGATVPMSVRGPRPDLEPSDEVSAVYTLQEAAFFGDLFRPAPERFVCIGGAFSTDALTDLESWYRQRLCSWQGGCAIQQQGFCTGLCRSVLGTYTDCNSWLDFDISTGDWRHYQEVVTIYLPYDSE